MSADDECVVIFDPRSRKWRVYCVGGGRVDTALSDGRSYDTYQQALAVAYRLESNTEYGLTVCPNIRTYFCGESWYVINSGCVICTGHPEKYGVLCESEDAANQLVQQLITEFPDVKLYRPRQRYRN